MSAAQESLVVLIPAYCSQAQLDETLKSVAAAERPCHVSAVVVDDGSPVPLRVDPALLPGVPATVVRLVPNRGIEAALNAGLDAISGMAPTYIARIDVGDRMDANRLLRQVEYLRGHAEIGLVGSHANFVDLNGKLVFQFQGPASDGAIRRAMHINSCLMHPTVTFRAAVLREAGLYSSRYPAAEDYEFFFRLLGHTKAANLTAPLTTMVLNPGGISVKRRMRQLVSRLKVQTEYFDWRLVQSYFGIMLTISLMLIPSSLVVALKRTRGASRY